MIDAFVTKKRIAQVKNLLLLERKALLEGPISEIFPAAMKREKLVMLLAEKNGSVPAVDMQEISDLAHNNQQLLHASLAGIKEAQQIISEQKDERKSLVTYTKSGQRLDQSGNGRASDRWA